MSLNKRFFNEKELRAVTGDVTQNVELNIGKVGLQRSKNVEQARI